jgi:predicted RNase H-like HicB family nuclease
MPLYDKTMRRIIQAHIYRGDSQFVAECVDLPVVTQGKTLDQVAKNLREAIALHLEGEDPAQFGLAENASILASIEIDVPSHVEA